MENFKKLTMYDENIETTISDRTEPLLDLDNVSKSVAKEYAEFCVRCDRDGLPLLLLDDYIEQYCC